MTDQFDLFTKEQTSMFHNEKLAAENFIPVGIIDDIWGYHVWPTCSRATRLFYFFDAKDPNVQKNIRVARSWSLLLTDEEAQDPIKAFVDWNSGYYRGSRNTGEFKIDGLPYKWEHVPNAEEVMFFRCGELIGVYRCATTQKLAVQGWEDKVRELCDRWQHIE